MKKLDYKLLGWFSFCAISFNVLMARGCDTQMWGFIIMCMTFMIFSVPFLPEDWLRMILPQEENNNDS